MHPTRVLSMFLFDCLLSVPPQWPGVCFSLHQLLMDLSALSFLDHLSTDSLSDMHLKIYIFDCAGSSRADFSLVTASMGHN